ncbi:MAG: protein kinase [Gemmatimonadetes bacterium]|nr:protein kinase [Gemmatimonadota bacterium]
MPALPPDLADALTGRYRLDGELGRGGMATVYLAHDVRHDRPVALKVLDAGTGSEEEARRFDVEVRTTARLNHPHILPLFEAGRAGRHRFYAMPVVDGESLADRLKREGRLPVAEAVGCVASIARALGHAHGEGVIHRDVKPANILVHRGQPVIADFGISRIADGSTRITATGHSVGTPHYMSPEQIGENVEPDGRADQYALACVAFELIGGTPPFPGTSARAVITAHLVTDPPALADVVPEAADLDTVLTRALAKQPEDRYPTMEAFATALESAWSTAVEARRAAEARGAEDGADDGGDSTPGLVVMPFANLSPDPDNEYFSDGLTEEVIADLSQLRGLRVISRTSALRLKNDERDLRELAEALDVRYVLEGGVRKAGDQLRITARLLDAQHDDHLWSERFAGTVEEIFEIQERVARATVEALSVRISPAEDKALSDRPIADPRAYESYLRARYEAWRFSPESLDRARRYIQHAIDLVGDNDLLWVTLGHILVMYVQSGGDTDPGTLVRVDEIADRVEALKPGSPRASWLRAFAAFQRGHAAEALHHGTAAWEGEPDDPDVLVLLGYVNANVGRTKVARGLVEQAVRLDPLTPITRLLPGFVAVFDGRPEDGVQPYREAWELDPESPFTAAFYGWALVHAGRHEDAIEVLEAVASRPDAGPFQSWTASLIHGLRGERDAAAAAITPAFVGAGRTTTMFARALADCWALAGEPEAALEWLEESVRGGLLNARYIAEYDPFLASLRPDPRFREFVRRVAARAAVLP